MLIYIFCNDVDIDVSPMPLLVSNSTKFLKPYETENFLIEKTPRTEFDTHTHLKNVDNISGDSLGKTIENFDVDRILRINR